MRREGFEPGLPAWQADVLTRLGVFLGRMFSKRIPLKYIKLGSGAIFLIFGIFSLLEYWKTSGLSV